jgi:hypothetical protein
VKTKIHDLSKKIQDYSDEWVVLSPGSMKVVASGKDMNEAVDKATKEGISHPVITRAPKNYGAYIL